MRLTQPRFLIPILLLAGVGVLVALAAGSTAYSYGPVGGPSSPSSGANAYFDAVCNQGNVDQLAAANERNEGGNFLIGDKAGSLYSPFYLGLKIPFAQVYAKIGTAGAGAGATMVWQYYNGHGANWQTLNVTGNWGNYFATGYKRFGYTPPADWVTSTSTCSGVSMYWIRAVQGGTLYTTNPRVDQISPAALNLKIKVQDELGNGLPGLVQSNFTIAGGSVNTIYNFTDAGSGVYYFGLNQSADVRYPAADVDYTVVAAKTGYVTGWNSTGNSLTTGSIPNTSPAGMKDKTGWPSKLRFSQKISITQELGAAFSGATVTGGSVTWQENGTTGIYFGAVTTSNDHNPSTITVAKSGYVTNTGASMTQRATAAAAQSSTSLANVRFGQKVTITRELDGAAFSGATVLNGGVTFTESGSTGVYYGAVPSASDGGVFQVDKAGYVRNTAVTSVDRAAETTAQGVNTITNVRFGQKVTVTREVDSAVVSGATVTNGGVTFTESGSTGVYYGAVPIGSDGAAITVVKAGYVTNTATSSTDRTSDADAQGTPSASNVRFGQKITVTREYDAAALSGATVTNGGITFLESGSTGIYYGAVLIANDGGAYTITKAGYVTHSTTNSVNRTADADAQGSASASNVRFGQMVTVAREMDGAALTGATVTNGGVTFLEAPAGVYYGAVLVGSDGGAISVSKSGYVTNTATNSVDRAANTTAQGTNTVSNVQFAQKITITREVDAAPLTGADVSTGGVMFNESGTSGVYYGAVPFASDGGAFTIAKPGYVMNTGTLSVNRANDAAAQGVSNTVNIRFGQKVTATREVDGAALSGAAVTSGGATFIESGATGIYYGAVPIASDNAAITIVKAGYVTNTAASTTDRSAEGDSQGVIAAPNVQFSQKVTATREVDGAALSGATVTNGGVTFIESGSSGIYYGNVVIGSDGGAITIAKDGYATNSATNSGDRSANADAQANVAAGNVRFTVRVTVATETGLAGVSWTRSINGGGFSAVTPNATSGNMAYFALSPSQANVVLRATKYSVSSDTTTFTPSAAAQQTFTVNLVSLLTQLLTSAGGLVAGQTTSYTFGFRPTHAWPSAGKLSITFNGNYSFSGPTATLSGADGTANVTAAGQTLTIARSGFGSITAANTPINVTITGIRNPQFSGATGTFALSFKDASAVVLDTGATPSVTITTGALTAVSASGTNYGAGNYTTYAVHYTLANPWPSTGRARITFPSGYNFGNVQATLAGADGTATASSDNGTHEVIVARAGDGTATAGSTAVTVTLTQVRNPTAAGATGTWNVETQLGAATPIDVGSGGGVTILPGPAAGFALTPSSVSIMADETEQFSASGQDQYANPVPLTGAWSTTCGSGASVNATGFFHAGTVVGTCLVNSTQDSLVGSATVNVIPNTLDHLRLSPYTASHDADAPNQTYTNEGFDEFDNSRGDYTANTTFTIAPGGWCVADACGANVTGNHTVTGDVSGSQGVAYLTITPGALDYLVLSPAAATVDADTSSQPYTAEGFDQFNNSRGDETNGTTFAIAPDGSCAGATCSATKTGIHDIQADKGGKTGATTLAITPGALHHAYITPNATTVTVAGTQQFTGRGQDQYDNNITMGLSWGASCGSVDPAGLYTAPDSPQSCTVTVSAGAFDAVANVTVQTGALFAIQVDRDGGSMWVGRTIAFHANGTDSLDNSVPPTPTWSTTCGSIDPVTGYYSATEAGTCTITATDGSVSGNASVTVNPGNLTATSATAAKNTGNTTTAYTFRFTIEHPWPANGRFTVTFPAGYDVSQAVAIAPKLESGINGTLTASVTGQTLILSRSGGTAATAGTSVTLAADKIRNPLVGGYTGTFAFATESSANYTIDAGTAAGVNIGPFPAAKIAMIPKTNVKTGDVASYSFNFKTPVAWPADGKFVVQFPGGFGLTPTAATLTGASGTATVAASGQNVTVTRANDGALVPAGTAVTIAFDGVKNTLASGKTAPFGMRFLDAADTVLSTSTDAKNFVTIVPGSLTAPVGTPNDARALNVTAYTLGFKVRNDLAPDGKIVVTLPGFLAKTPTWAVDGNGFQAFASTGVSGASFDGGWTVAASGAYNRSIMISRDGAGTTIPAGTNITFTLTSIKNGVKSGAFGFETRTSSGAVTDALTKGPAPAITANALAIEVKTSSHTVGKWEAKKSRLDTVNVTWKAPKGFVADGYSLGYDGNVDEVADYNGATLLGQLVAVPDGLHTIQLRAFNATTGWTPISQLGLIGIDRTAPVAPLVGSTTHPLSACGSSRVPTINWSGSDATSGLDAKKPWTATIDGAGAKTATATATTWTAAKAIAPGAHTFAVTARDAMGFTTTSSYLFTVCN